MTYRKALPSIEGWYWVRHGKWFMACLRVEEDELTLFVVEDSNGLFQGEFIARPLSWPIEWFGPILMPVFVPEGTDSTPA